MPRRRAAALLLRRCCRSLYRHLPAGIERRGRVLHQPGRPLLLHHHHRSGQPPGRGGAQAVDVPERGARRRFRHDDPGQRRPQPDSLLAGGDHRPVLLCHGGEQVGGDPPSLHPRLDRPAPPGGDQRLLRGGRGRFGGHRLAGLGRPHPLLDAVRGRLLHGHPLPDGGRAAAVDGPGTADLPDRPGAPGDGSGRRQGLAGQTVLPQLADVDRLLDTDGGRGPARSRHLLSASSRNRAGDQHRPCPGRHLDPLAAELRHPRVLLLHQAGSVVRPLGLLPPQHAAEGGLHQARRRPGTRARHRRLELQQPESRPPGNGGNDRPRSGGALRRQGAHFQRVPQGLPGRPRRRRQRRDHLLPRPSAFSGVFPS